MTLSGLDVIARSDDFETHAAAYELRGWQWAFLHELDGAAELRDVAMAGGVDLDLAIDFVAESEAAGLVRVVSMTLSDYRKLNNIPEPEAAGETLASYENAPPAWMMEHHDEAAAHVEDHHEAVAEHHEAVAENHEAVAEWTPDAHAAEYHEEPVAEWTPDAHVAEHHEAAAEWTPDAHAAEYYDQPIAEWTPDAHVAEQHEEVAEWTPDAHAAAHHEEPAAEYHDAAAEHGAPSYEWTPDAHAAAYHEEPAAEYHEAAAEHGAPSYEWTPDSHVADASSAVADLMSLQPHDDSDAYAGGHPVSLSIGDEPEAAPVTANGHSANGHSTNGHSSYSWEPMSLVTTVGAAPVEPAHDEQPASEMHDGISISLAATDDHSEPAAHYEPAPEPDFEPQEQGSISFSFFPESEPEPATHAQQATAYAPEPAAQAPAYEPAREPVHAMHAEASEPAAAHADMQDAPGAEAPQQLRMDAQSAQNGKGDLVGNLIARAFTFRIK